MKWLVAEQFPASSVRSTRRIRPDWAPEGVSAAVGFKNKTAVGVQAWWFSAGRSGKWTQRQARAWLKKNGYKAGFAEYKERPQLGLNLRAAREAVSLSQVAVGECCELTSQYISNLECGAVPSLKTLAMLAIIYDCEIADLLRDVPVDELLDTE